MNILSSLDIESDNEDSSMTREDSSNMDTILSNLDYVVADIKTRIVDSLVVAEGTKVFVKRYKEMIKKGKFSNAAIGSALHKFGWVFGGSVRSTQGGHLRRGRRIPVSAKAAGRRRGKLSRGKAKAIQGRPKGMKVAVYSQSPSKFTLQPRRVPKGKRPHSLKSSIINNTQNSGKW